MKHRILICGDRNWTDEEMIRNCLLSIGPENINCIIQGGARGADRIAASVATNFKIQVLSFPAKWDLHGRSAGVIRNQQMLDEGKPTGVIAFHDNLDESKGTKDMIRRARKAGLSTAIVSHREGE